MFTTGRGTPTGHALAPVLKVTGNRDTFERMHDNIDIGVCEIMEGTCTKGSHRGLQWKNDKGGSLWVFRYSSGSYLPLYLRCNF